MFVYRNQMTLTSPRVSLLSCPEVYPGIQLLFFVKVDVVARLRIVDESEGKYDANLKGFLPPLIALTPIVPYCRGGSSPTLFVIGFVG